MRLRLMVPAVLAVASATASAWWWLPSAAPVVVARQAPWLDAVVRAVEADADAFAAARERLTAWPSDALPALLPLLDHGDPDRRAFVCAAVAQRLDSGGDLGTDHHAVRAALILRCDADADDQVRAAAAHALGRWRSGAEGVAACLLRLLSASGRDVREAAIAALHRHATADALPDLLTARQDAGPHLRGCIDVLLLSLGRAEEFPGLVRMLDHERGDVRLQAALDLGLIGDQRGIDPLLDALERRPPGSEILDGLDSRGLVRLRADTGTEGGWLGALVRMGQPGRSLPLVVGILSNQVPADGGRCEAGALRLIDAAERRDGRDDASEYLIREGSADWELAMPGLRDRLDGRKRPVQTVSLPRLRADRPALSAAQEDRLMAILLNASREADAAHRASLDQRLVARNG